MMRRESEIRSDVVIPTLYYAPYFWRRVASFFCFFSRRDFAPLGDDPAKLIAVIVTRDEPSMLRSTTRGLAIAPMKYQLDLELFRRDIGEDRNQCGTFDLLCQ